ncbi:MAG: LytTR family DNA-binding domain-containing protein [Lachnospiraceae bacterium]
MQIAICDDEREIRNMLGEKLKRIYPDSGVSFYESGDELLLSDSQPDILLLDIRMEGKNGMETAKELRGKNKKMIVIFITALEEYVFQAFDVGAFHYLVKPFDDKKFEEIIRKAVEELKNMEESENIKKESLIITSKGKHISVNPADIIYAEVFNRKVILHTINTDVEYYGKMKELEERAGEDFYRPHRSYLVNFNYIIRYDAETIYLKKGQALMSKQNYKEFKKSYLRYNQRKGRKNV